MQFNKFNEMYRNMRNSYQSSKAKVRNLLRIDTAQAKVASPVCSHTDFLFQVQELETELLAAKAASEQISREHAAVVASMKSDLADMKANHAHDEATTARALKEHQEAERNGHKKEENHSKR